MAVAAALAAPAVAQAGDMAQVRVHRTMALDSACPGVRAQLSEDLYPAWRAIDSAADVIVDFKLDGGKVRDVQMSGGHGDYVQPVRHAIKAMKCSGADDAAVRVKITFQYPEDKGSALAVQFADVVPALASR
jgi:hypothetical protein